MKAQFKHGMLVSYKREFDTEARYGIVSAVITRTDGYAYEVDDGERVNSADIIAGFTPIKARSKTAGKKRAAKVRAAKSADAAAVSTHGEH